MYGGGDKGTIRDGRRPTDRGGNVGQRCGEASPFRPRAPRRWPACAPARRPVSAAPATAARDRRRRPAKCGSHWAGSAHRKSVGRGDTQVFRQCGAGQLVRGPMVRQTVPHVNACRRRLPDPAEPPVCQFTPREGLRADAVQQLRGRAVLYPLRGQGRGHGAAIRANARRAASRSSPRVPAGSRR